MKNPIDSTVTVPTACVKMHIHQDVEWPRLLPCFVKHMSMGVHLTFLGNSAAAAMVLTNLSYHMQLLQLSFSFVKCDQRGDLLEHHLSVTYQTEMVLRLLLITVGWRLWSITAEPAQQPSRSNPCQATPARAGSKLQGAVANLQQSLSCHPWAANSCHQRQGNWNTTQQRVDMVAHQAVALLVATVTVLAQAQECLVVLAGCLKLSFASCVASSTAARGMRSHAESN